MSKKKKSDNDIIISCLGTSQLEVTGSSWSISYPKNDNKRGLIVLECGLSQSSGSIEKHYNSNKRMIENIGKEVIESCEYVFLGHQHIDHCGNVPIFNNDNGFNGKILGSYETIEISKDLIRDSVFIHNKNIEYLKGKGGKQSPLYTQPQMLQMFDHMESVEVNKKIKLNDNLSVTFYTNSHVVGSTSIFLEFRKPNNSIKTVLYTSDMGSEINRDLQPYISDNKLPRKCNMLISEATYSDKDRQFTRKEAIKEREELKGFIKQNILEGKRILFATFSFSRSQLLMSTFYNWFKDEEWFEDIPVVVDGVLVGKINNTYLQILNEEDKQHFANVLHWKNMKFNKTYDGTMAILSQYTCGIYISSSGFCENGKITSYLQQFLGNAKDSVVLTGFAGNEGSVGWKISNPQQKTVTIDKKVIVKKATVRQLYTFSSHISYLELLKLFSEMNCDKILIHHCNDKNKYKFCQEAKEYLESKGKTTPIVPVNKASDQFIL